MKRGGGLASGGGRLPGRGGADAGQCLSGAGRQPRDRPGPEQDRPARRRARAHRRADRGRDRHRRLGRGADLRQDRPRHRGRAGGHRHPPAPADRHPRRAAQGDAGGQLVRRVSGRGGPDPRDGGRPQEGRAHPHDGHRRRLPGGPRRRVRAGDAPDRRARPRRDRLPDRLDQAGPRHPRRRHHHP